MTGPGDGQPHTNSVVARFEGGWRCRVEAGGFDLVVDEPPSSGGTGAGSAPGSHLGAGLARPTATSIGGEAAIVLDT